jgi:hypothetical protein
MTRHCMIDLETLSTRKTAALLSIGAIKFDPAGDNSKLIVGGPRRVEDIQSVTDSFYRRIVVESNKELGLHVDADTVKWWMRQSEEAKAEAFMGTDRVPVRQAMDEFYLWFSGAEFVWSKGASFDCAILAEIFAIIGRKAPWKYPAERCVRTAYDLGSFDEKSQPRNALAHHPLFDAWHQIVGVQQSHANIYLPKPTAA